MHVLESRQVIDELGMEHLHGCSTLGALSELAIRFLLDEGDILCLDKGDTLFQFGEPGDCFHVVLRGAVSFYKPHKGETVHIRDYTKGQEIGFVAMVGLHARVGDGSAAEESIVLKVCSDVFHDLHSELPTDFGLLLLNLSRELARRLRESDDKLAEHDIHI